MLRILIYKYTIIKKKKINFLLKAKIFFSFTLIKSKNVR